MLLKRTAASTLVYLLMTALADASIFVTDNAGDANLWIYFMPSPDLAECSIYSGEFVDSAASAGVIVYQAPTAPAADKLVFVTDDPGQADDPACLTQ